MRLIGADALKLSHCKECTLYPNECMGDDCDWNSIVHIRMMPAIDAEPVRHGHWITHPWAEIICDHFVDDHECSECHNWQVFDTDYCPCCGAKMDEVKEE